jgi:hypothetical protein
LKRSQRKKKKLWARIGTKNRKEGK